MTSQFRYALILCDIGQSIQEVYVEKLVDEKGLIQWGIYSDPVERVNYEDYRLETPMGLKIPAGLKKFLANQFHFIGVIGPDMIIGIGVVDLKYLSNAFFYVFDRKTGTITESKKLVPLSSSILIDPCPEKPRSVFKGKGLTIEITGDSIKATGKGVVLDIAMDSSAARPLRICTRAGYRGWVYTQKTSPLNIKGSLTAKGIKKDISSPDYMALSDWTCGFMRRETCWNWAASAFTMGDGRSLGMNLSCGVNETSFTENVFWINGHMNKVDTVNFIFDKDSLDSPWHIKSADKKVDLVFKPEASRGENINALLIKSRFTQLFGVFEGKLLTKAGEVIAINDCPGFAEDHFARW
ncbi:MAG TPA: DUF2804 domain-containing protein [Deltaproteobacteria bacterium]|nr:DUF2804 domain-containing protein [Deltaproteobacteria bacterium]